MSMTRPRQRPRASTTSRSPGLLCFLLPILCSCNHTGSYVRHYSLISPERLIVILPQEREDVPVVKEYLAHKEQQGYSVEVIAFSSDLPEAERMTTVQSRLAEKRPGDGQY